MKKIGLFLTGFLLVYSIYKYTNRNEEIMVQDSTASWSTHYDDYEELIEQSDAICKVVVTSQQTQLRNGIVFTMQYCTVEEALSGSVVVGEELPVLQTGGYYQNFYTPEISSAPLLESSKEYLVFLQQTEYDERYGQYYLIMGGYQGMATIQNDVVSPVSDENDIFEKDNYIFGKKNYTYYEIEKKARGGK